MTNETHPNTQARWLHFKAMCKYVDLSTTTMEAKLLAGVGPKFHRSPGSKNKIFWTPDLDDWIVNSPERQMTPAERARLVKLQAGAERVREQRRARRQAKIEEDVTA
jgi:hypothetical protein